MDLGNHDPRVRGYIEDVLAGRVVVGRLVRLAVQRHVTDLEQSAADPTYPYRFDQESAQLALDFCALARHWKGEWVGQQFEPLPWQAFLLSTAFGWLRRSDGYRRYREVLVEVAKKNGKTFLAAIIALYLLVLDDEAGAEIYSTATKLDQAKLAWIDARQIVRASPALQSRIDLPRGEHAYTMSVISTGSKYRALSADNTGSDGVMPSGVINDELHRQVGRDLYDVLKYGSRSRRQPLFCHFTTAGDENDETIYAEVHDYAVQVLEGRLTGPSADEFFGLVYTLDDGDSWQDRSTWVKANPGLGANLRMDDLEKDFQEAQAKPGAEAAFKRLRLNVRTTTTTPWIRPEDWDACRTDIDWSTFAGEAAWAGLDLSTTTDLTAYALVYPHGDEIFVRCFTWCPEEGITRRSTIDRVPYDVWSRQGWIKPTPGRTIDYQFVEAEIREQAKTSPMREIGYDQAKASDVATRMADAGLPVVAVPQGPVHMTLPVNRLEDLVLAGKLHHDGNPVLAWAVDNARCKEAAGGLKRIIKSSYRGRIDPVQAVLIALRRYFDTRTIDDFNPYEDYYGDPPAEGQSVSGPGTDQSDSGTPPATGDAPTPDIRGPLPSVFDTWYDQEEQHP